MPLAAAFSHKVHTSPAKITIVLMAMQKTSWQSNILRFFTTYRVDTSSVAQHLGIAEREMLRSLRADEHYDQSRFDALMQAVGRFVPATTWSANCEELQRAYASQQTPPVTRRHKDILPPSDFRGMTYGRQVARLLGMFNDKNRAHEDLQALGIGESSIGARRAEDPDAFIRRIAEENHAPSVDPESIIAAYTALKQRYSQIGEASSVPAKNKLPPRIEALTAPSSENVFLTRYRAARVSLQEMFTDRARAEFWLRVMHLPETLPAQAMPRKEDVFPYKAQLPTAMYDVKEGITQGQLEDACMQAIRAANMLLRYGRSDGAVMGLPRP